VVRKLAQKAQNIQGPPIGRKLRVQPAASDALGAAARADAEARAQESRFISLVFLSLFPGPRFPSDREGALRQWGVYSPP